GDRRRGTGALRLCERRLRLLALARQAGSGFRERRGPLPRRHQLLLARRLPPHPFQAALPRLRERVPRPIPRRLPLATFAAPRFEPLPAFPQPPCGFLRAPGGGFGLVLSARAPFL